MDESNYCVECGARLIGDFAPCPFGHVRREAPGGDHTGQPPSAGWTGPEAGPAFGAPTPLPAWVTSPVPPGFGVLPPQSSGGHRARRAVKAVLAAALVVAVGCGAVAYADLRRADPGPSHPDRWDPRVADIAGWVEMERGLDFEEPVHVDFLTAAEYSEFVRADEPVDEAAEDGGHDDGLDDLVGWYRAFGLLEGSHDLGAVYDDLYDSGTLALYDHRTERITVRGTELTPSMEVTLAHELTHALQDQHFDLGRLDSFDGVRQEAFRAVAEGDADRIDQAYIEDELTGSERDAYYAEVEAMSDGADTALAETVPDIVQTGFGSSYLLGGGFIAVVDEAGGNEAINEALTDPPRTDEQLFDPFSYLDHEKAVEVEAPTPADDAEVLDQGEFGATVLFLVLASRIDAHEALAAVDGWGGDVAVVSRHEDRICIDLAVTGEDEGATARLADALRRWSEATPGDHDEVSATADAVTVVTCDPGADAALSVTPDVGRFLSFPEFRSYVGAAVMRDGGSRSEAECFTRAVTAQADIVRLEADDGYVESMEYQRVLGEARRSCID